MKFLLFIVFFVIGGTIGSRRKRVVDRKLMSIEDVPYSVTLLTDNNRLRCGAALITRKHVLTAFHCIFTTDKNGAHSLIYKKLVAVTGTIDPYIGRNRHSIEHADWPGEFLSGQGLSFDIAVLMLADSIADTPTQKPIDLPEAKPLETRDGLLIGLGCPMPSERSFYGRIYRLWNSYPVMTSFSTSILTAAECRPLVNQTVRDDIICGVHSKTCPGYSGDSGGALVQNGKIVGVYSWIIRKPDKNVSGFTNVRLYLDFIKNVTGML